MITIIKLYLIRYFSVRKYQNILQERNYKKNRGIVTFLSYTYSVL